MVSSSPFRRVGRYIGYTIGGVAITTAAVMTPPKEALPSSLLPTRVLLEGMGRVGRCAYVSGQIFLDYAWTLQGSEGGSTQELWNMVHQRSAERLVVLAETNGGLYVKAGQIFANMSHVLPRQYCTTMAALQDAVVKRPFSEIVATLERDFGRPVSDVFSTLDPIPIAAASLAQVHRGTLRREGVDVAVKVQYIDIAQRFRGDMRTIQVMLNIAGFLFRGYDFSDIVVKLNSTVANELDFELEADNSERAGQELKKGGFGDRVVTAKVFRTYTTRRVLTTELVKGAVKMSDLAGMQARGIPPATVATWLYDALSYQMFVTGFIHGDPHAGNVLVHRLSNGQPQVVMLDFGLCTELTDKLRVELAAIWTSAVTHDTAQLKELAKKFNCEDYALFASCFLQHPYEVFDSGSRISTKATQEMMRDHMKHKMHEINEIVSKLPKEYALVLRNIMAAKAINKELHDPVNRPLRMLRYSVVATSSSKSYINVWVMLFRAWWSEMVSTILMSFAKWKNPELVKTLDDTMQFQLCG